MLKLARQSKAKLEAMPAAEKVLNELILQMTRLAFRGSLDNIIARIQAEADKLLAGFFVETSRKLGKRSDILSQLGSGFGAVAWAPLSASWVERKGHADFFAWKSSPKWNGRRGRRRDPPLIPTIAKGDPVKAFGRPRVELISYLATQGTARDVIHDVQLSVKLFGDTPPSAMANIEWFIVKNGGLPNTVFRKTADNGIKPYRPIFNPMMAYYTRVRLPVLLQQVAARKSTVGVSAATVRVSVRAAR